MSGQVINVGAQELDCNTAYCMFCACVQKQSGEEMMLSEIMDCAEMVSRTNVTSVMTHKLVLVELTAILKPIQFTYRRSL